MVLPTPKQAYDMLCRTGGMFPRGFSPSSLPGVYFQHPEKGRQNVHIDERVLPVLSRIYTNDDTLSRAVQAYGASVGTLSSANALVQQRLTGGLVWGFSGFATAGRPYSVEAGGMREIYRTLGQARKPALVVDGGVSAGVLGLSGVLAIEFGTETLGVIPLQGLGSIGPRNRLLVWGNTYRDRERMVGTLPDILCCVGGADGTLRECLAAVEQGSIVVLLALQDYGSSSLPGSYKKYEELRLAAKNGTLFVCHSISNIATCINAALEAHARLDNSVRTRRKKAISKLLAS